MLQDVDSIDQKLIKNYQSLIGSLLNCAVNTPPDVAFAVGYLCRAMGRPTPELYSAALRVLFYLHHHRHVGLRYEADSRELTGQSDSDWAVKHGAGDSQDFSRWVLLRKDGSAEEMDGFDDQDFDAQNEDVDMPE